MEVVLPMKQTSSEEAKEVQEKSDKMMQNIAMYVNVN
jgi:hypothetical protein